MNKRLSSDTEDMGQKKITVTIYICERCKHQWQARRKGERPKVCARCKSAYWDRPRKR